MKPLLLGSMVSVSLKAVGAGLSFLMFVLLARVLGAVEYGHFASMFALGTAGAIAALFGQHTLSMKTLASLEGRAGAAADRRRALRQSHTVAFAGALVVMACLLAGGAGLAWLGVPIDMRYLIGACALVLPFAFSDLVAHQVRAFGHILWALAPRDIFWRGAIILACLSGLPFLFSNALSAMVTLSATLMAIGIVQLGAMLAGQRQILLPDPDETPTVTLDWRVSGWMWLASLGTMGASLNLAVAALFLSPDLVGAYFAAQKVSQLLQLPIMAVDIAATPLFARLYSRNDITGLCTLGRKLAMLVSVPLLLGTAIIALFASQLLALFDPFYADAVFALILLAASYLLIGLGGPTRQLMLMSNGERHVVRLTLISETIGLALIPLFVPSFGIVGAALAVCVTRLLFTTMTVLWCRAKLGVDTSVFSLLPALSVSR